MSENSCTTKAFFCFVFYIVSDHARSFISDFSCTKTVHSKRKQFCACMRKNLEFVSWKFLFGRTELAVKSYTLLKSVHTIRKSHDRFPDENIRPIFLSVLRAFSPCVLLWHPVAVRSLLLKCQLPFRGSPFLIKMLRQVTYLMAKSKSWNSYLQSVETSVRTSALMCSLGFCTQQPSSRLSWPCQI